MNFGPELELAALVIFCNNTAAKPSSLPAIFHTRSLYYLYHKLTSSAMAVITNTMNNTLTMYN